MFIGQSLAKFGGLHRFRPGRNLAIEEPNITPFLPATEKQTGVTWMLVARLIEYRRQTNEPSTSIAVPERFERDDVAIGGGNFLAQFSERYHK